ncbi:Histone H2A-like protein 1 [Sarcoptes scabiei]|uniref:DNA polymerase epsilon subunit 3 n=1 Tax=Sarcoptes scabiei TaxID=52283 RepID=A0A131ZY95_SARSC|nr:Histone H2A-like protein 1 [Sarcoptes scabiei]
MASNPDFTVPLSVVTKIFIDTLPEHFNITIDQDLIKALSRAAHLFIMTSTAKANAIAGENNRRTVHSQDIINAIVTLGFEHLVPILIDWHSTYIEEREFLKSRRKKASTADDAQGLVSSDQMEVEIITTEEDNLNEDGEGE